MEKGGKEWRERKNRGQETEESKKVREGKSRRRDQASPFIAGHAAWLLQVTVGRGIPGCSQVTVGWSSARILGAGIAPHD